MRVFLVLSLIIFSLFLGGVVSPFTKELKEEKNKEEIILKNREDVFLEQEEFKDLTYGALSEDEMKKIKNKALSYKEKSIFLDLGATIEGFKDIGRNRYYVISLYSKSVKGEELTGIIDRILIDKKGKLLKGENGVPLNSIYDMERELNIENKDIINLENLAREYEAKLLVKDLYAEVLGEKEKEGEIYYEVFLYSKSLREKDIIEPLEKLYVNKKGRIFKAVEI